MADTSFTKHTDLFSGKLPNHYVLFLVLIAMSIIVGIAAVSISHYGQISSDITYFIASGATTGILVIFLPTLLTTIIIRALTKHIKIKYILFAAMAAAASYALFMIVGSALYTLMHSESIAIIIVLVGDASIFAWWFFMNKVLFGRKRSAFPISFIQPTLNILTYIPYSYAIFSFQKPFSIIIVKLYAAIFVFAAISYLLLHIFNSPSKKNIGFDNIDAFSQMVRNWLFDIELASPFGGSKFGENTNVNTDTLVFLNKHKKPKAALFVPEIHYGPAGTLGGSNFPFMIEDYSSRHYKIPAIVLHGAVDIDMNPLSISQFGRVRKAFDDAITKSITKNQKADVKSMQYQKVVCGNSRIIKLTFGSADLITFTRAPKVTEDISRESAKVFRVVAEENSRKAILVDAHNSRYESAKKQELDGVKLNSEAEKEYLLALAKKGTIKNASKIMMGVSSENIYAKMADKVDIAPGNMNVVVFAFNGFKYAIIQFNSNNILPKLRNNILKMVKKKYKIDAEIYTTDTHAVNSMRLNESNVLGRYTTYEQLEKFVDNAVRNAIDNIEEVYAVHVRSEIKNFKVWGSAASETLFSITNSTLELGGIIAPILIAAGFIFAAWIISLI